MELPESQCKKVKLSNRVPSWVSGERCACGQMGVWSGRGEQRGKEAVAELGGDVAVGGGRAGGSLHRVAVAARGAPRAETVNGPGARAP